MSGVPVELTDLTHPVWATKKAAIEFLSAHELPTNDRKLDYGPVNRCLSAGKAWAWKAGLTRDVPWGQGRDLDLERMRELGIRGGSDGQGSGQERSEWLARQVSASRRT